VECERCEREIVAAQSEERNADERRDHACDDGCHGDRPQGIDSRVGIEEAIVGVESDG
jgi:hypothetical protein